jgi:long-chain acyl-CoA synthetase
VSANVAEILAPSARPALLYEGERISYAELDRRAGAVAALLREHGVVAGDRVALMLPNTPSYVAAFFGVLRTGAVLVPLNILLRAREIAERLDVATPRLVLADEERALEVGRVTQDVVLLDDESRKPVPGSAPVEDRDAAVILFTSGTSGKAKGAVLTHGGIGRAARNVVDALALGPGDVVLGAAPFSHVLGQSAGIVATLLAGAAIAVVPRFDAEQTLALMAETQTTILLGVPSMCIALCNAARTATQLPPVRIAHVGGAAVPVEVARDFERTFGGEVYEGYGLTELSGLATTYVAGQTRKPGSVGMPLGGTEMRTDAPPGEVGEVQFRGPTVIPGYWEDPQATAEAIDAEGWLSTGDVGYIDEDGYLFLVDRKKDVIIRGGYNVYPREVEEVLYAHPSVLEAAVVGVPHDTLGEDVAALIVARPGASIDEDAISAYARERLAAYKIPRRIVFVDHLPKGPTGKILKRAIDRAALLSRLSDC